jgi:predicted nucleic acid-binding protein
MRKLRIYLDTSVINFIFADDAPEKKSITIDFFSNYVKNNIYEVFISPVVLDEINKTTDKNKKQRLLDTIQEYSIEVIDISTNRDEIENLAFKYIEHSIIPRNKLEDALHIAICSVLDIDLLLSWNYRHLANINKESKIIALNINEGYNRPLRIVTPMEAIYE